MLKFHPRTREHVAPLMIGMSLTCMTDACAGPHYAGGQLPYRPRVMTIPGTPAEREQVVMAHARSEGWSISRSNGRIEALTPERPLAGVPSRERWIFDFVGEDVLVSRRLEVLFNPTTGKWVWSPNVCSGYRYEAEQSHIFRMTFAHADLSRQTRLDH